MNRRRTLLIVLTLAVAACSELPGSTPETQADLTTIAPVTTGATASTSPTTTTPLTLPEGPRSGICLSYEDPVVAGTVSIDDLNEISGIAVSRTHPEIVWMHNDSGGGPLVYASTLDGEPMGTFVLETDTFDWEDMTIGPGPDPAIDYLYLGDIGDNLHFRPTVVVHRIAEPEPDPAGGVVTVVDEINLIYPESGPDAESLFVDPVTGALFVVTKPEAGGVAIIYQAPAADLVDGASIALTEVGRFQLDAGLFVTGADIDSSGSLIVFRGYNEVWLWQRTDLDLVDTFKSDPCMTPSTAEVQGEAISFAASGYSYYTMSEGRDPDINYVFSIFD